MTEAPEILSMAAEAIQDRAADRDMNRERSMGRAVDLFNALTGNINKMTEREGWIFMACLKMARSQQGGHRLDDYVDGAAYFALAGECAERDGEKHETPKT